MGEHVIPNDINLKGTAVGQIFSDYEKLYSQEAITFLERHQIQLTYCSPYHPHSYLS